jgi:hypothetical protein
MARRIVALLLMLVGVWLFAPTSTARPVFACSPTGVPPVTASPSPLPNFTPPPATAAPSPLPATPTFTPEQRLSQLVGSSQVAVVGTIRTVNEDQVLLDVEAYTNISELTSPLTITTYSERSGVDSTCDLTWYREKDKVVSLRYQGKQAVFFLESYESGQGVAVVGRGGAILHVYDGELYALDSAESFGPAAQLDAWPRPGAATAQTPATAASDSSPRWPLIAAAALALLSLTGLILKRSKPSKT